MTKLDLIDFDIRNPSPASVLFQAGYLTIVDFDKTFRLYTLDYPNLEVRQAYGELLLKTYLADGDDVSPRARIARMLSSN